ncbi:MAG: hypothetical protein ACRD98_00575 [Nitrososphaera sp.]
MAGKAKVDIIHVSPFVVPTIWDRIEHYIIDSVNEAPPGYYSLPDVREACMPPTPVYQMHVILVGGKIAGCLLSDIVPTHGVRLYRLCFLGGSDMESWVDALRDYVMHAAKQHACRYVEVVGRRGWSRALKKFGIDYQLSLLVKKV